MILIFVLIVVLAILIFVICMLHAMFDGIITKRKRRKERDDEEDIFFDLGSSPDRADSSDDDLGCIEYIPIRCNHRADRQKDRDGNER